MSEITSNDDNGVVFQSDIKNVEIGDITFFGIFPTITSHTYTNVYFFEDISSCCLLMLK
jgi:hypothetical protein